MMRRDTKRRLKRIKSRNKRYSKDNPNINKNNGNLWNMICKIFKC